MVYGPIAKVYTSHGIHFFIHGVGIPDVCWISSIFPGSARDQRVEQVNPHGIKGLNLIYYSHQMEGYINQKIMGRVGVITRRFPPRNFIELLQIHMKQMSIMEGHRTTVHWKVKIHKIGSDYMVVMVFNKFSILKMIISSIPLPKTEIFWLLPIKDCHLIQQWMALINLNQ